jgi:hypothetical protein
VTILGFLGSVAIGWVIAALFWWRLEAVRRRKVVRCIEEIRQGGHRTLSSLDMSHLMVEYGQSVLMEAVDRMCSRREMWAEPNGWVVGGSES